MNYIVINQHDAAKYIATEELTEFGKQLANVSRKVHEGRVKDGKEPVNNYLVINKDESYINEIIEIMKRNGHWGN